MAKRSTPVDAHVGSRLRVRRTLLGLSQQQLGDALGLTYQQVQKYENGSNRIGASRLYQISRVLDVPVSYFFEGLPESVEAAQPLPAGKAPPTQRDPMAKRETLEFLRAYYRIEDPAVRNRVRELVRAIAGSEG